MASQLEAPVGLQNQHYVNTDEYVDYQLYKMQAKIKATDFFSAVCGSLVLFLSYLLVFVFLDHWVITGGFDRTTRVIMLLLLVGATSCWIYWKLIKPSLRKVNQLFAANSIEQAEPGLKSTLLNLVDMEQAGISITPEIRNTLEKRAAVTLSHMDLEEVVDRRQLMGWSYALLIVVVLCCLYALFSPKKISNSIWRALFPAAQVAVATRTEIVEVNPGNANILSRTPLEVIVSLQGEIPEAVTLHYTTSDKRYVDEPMPMEILKEGIRQYRCLLTGENGRGLLQGLSYYIVAGDARSEQYQVTVTRPPSATVQNVTYQYPEYMNKETLTLAGGQIKSWEGTEVTIRAKTNMPVSSATILFSDTEDTSQKALEIPMELVDAQTLEATWKLEFHRDDLNNREPQDRRYYHFYRIQCETATKQKDPAPTLYTIEIQPDLAPEVALLDPTRDIARPANAIVPLMVQARDPDFNLRFVTLYVQKNGDLIFSDFIFDGLQPSYSGTYDFHLDKLILNAAEKQKAAENSDEFITYWIEAVDNKNPKPNRKSTHRLKIKILQNTDQEEVQRQLAEDKKRQQEQHGDQQQPEPQDQNNQGKNQNPEQNQPQDDQQKTAADQNNQNTDKKQQEQNSDAAQKKQNKSSQQNGADQKPQSGDEKQKSLENDGSQDAEALEKILEHQQKKQQQPKAGSQDKTGDQDQQNGGGQQPRQGKPDPQDDPDGNAGQNSGDDAPGKSNANENKAGGETDQPGDMTNKPDKSNSSGNKPGDNQDGPREATDNDKDAQKGKADGSESGTAKPETDPNAETTKSKGDLQRDPNEKPTTRPSDSSDNSKPGQNQQNDPGSSNSQPGQNQQQSPDGAKNNQTGKPGQGNSAGQKQQKHDNKSNSPSPSGKKNGQQQADPGTQSDGQPSEDIKSQPDSKSSDQKQSGTPQSGQQNADDQKSSGKQGDGPSKQGDQTKGQPGQGESGQPGQGKQGENGQKSQNGQPGESSNTMSTQSGDSDSNSSKTGSGKNSSQNNAKDGAGAEHGGNPNAEQSPNGQGGSQPPLSEEAKLEYTKAATNLVLDKLDKELKRGDVDDELLKKLGWSEQELEKFTQRLKKQLEAGQSVEGETPEDIAKRTQFEEMLKSINLNQSSQRREAGRVPTQDINSFGGERLPVPAEYRDAYDAYTKSLSKRVQSR